MASGKKTSEKFQLGNKIKEIVFSSRGFPIFLSFTTLAILFVLFRMKNVEMDYKISKTNRDIEKVLLDNKELKAKNARITTIKRSSAWIAVESRSCNASAKPNNPAPANNPPGR